MEIVERSPWKRAPVGGIWGPVNKFALLAPYIGLVSTILVATAATAIYVKRVKHIKVRPLIEGRNPISFKILEQSVSCPSLVQA